MANTSIDVINVLYQTLKTGVLMTDAKKPNGKICRFERPLNSVLEDVVIGDLGLNRGIVQKGILNVNIYVLNMNYSKIPNHPQVNDHSQPDTARILILSRLANTALGGGNELWDINGDYCFQIQQDSIYQDENNQHYINLRVEFNSHNI